MKKTLLAGLIYALTGPAAGAIFVWFMMIYIENNLNIADYFKLMLMSIFFSYLIGTIPAALTGMLAVHIPDQWMKPLFVGILGALASYICIKLLQFNGFSSEDHKIIVCIGFLSALTLSGITVYWHKRVVL